MFSWAAGIFVDLDHLLDYYANYKFTFDYKAMYRAIEEVRLRRIYLFLHSYELVILWWACIAIFSLGDIWKAGAIGLTQHLVFDAFTNPLNVKGYFLLYRIKKRFRKMPIILTDKLKKRRKGK